MKQGYLSQYFKGVASKKLSEVEVNPELSHQHEFNGVKKMMSIFGETEGKRVFDAKFMYFNDLAEQPLADDGTVTWYDARAKARLERGVNRQEYRLYFTKNLVMQRASVKDLLVIAILPDENLLVLVAENGSSFEQQFLWLFGISVNEGQGFSVRSSLDEEKDRIGYSAGIILDQIGVEVNIGDQRYLEDMLSRFKGGFPSSEEFSSYARSTCNGISSLDDPDGVLVKWMKREEILFRTLERHLLSIKLNEISSKELYTDNVIGIVQSALQRRKSRAGKAMENHLETIFLEHKLKYTRTGVTEGKLKPDFIFPGIEEYHDLSFPHSFLTMLAAKQTCKDRWRQILNEAKRIPQKHLVTSEAGISVDQTSEMKAERVQLVVPKESHGSYTESQRSWIMSLGDFLVHVKNLQEGFSRLPRN